MAAELSIEDALTFLSCGELEILGMLPYASNATLMTRCTHGQTQGLAIYKPRRGERPLWDFPDGTLHLREVAAFAVSESLGWHLVPPTVLRDGPMGVGAVQLFITEDDEADPREIGRTHPDVLRRVALFDAIANNADRKLGHLLIDQQSRVWGIDHGICFHVEDKLRTVIWMEGEAIPPELLEDVRAMRPDLTSLLAAEEIDAMHIRIDRLLDAGVYPGPSGDWPAVPWPPW